ncbi:MAG: class I adenylate-forming enzyme family protein [Alphaproteobacteria bacterium]
MLTITSMLTRIERVYGRRPGIIDAEGTFTWSQFMDRVRRAGGVLASMGVKRGGRFAIIASPCFRQQELLHAGYWMGAVPVPVNFRLSPPEIAYILDDADCSLVAVEDTYAEFMQADALKPWAGNVLRIASPGAEKSPNSDWPNYEDRLAGAEPAAMHEPDEDEDALLLYTGGTTGRSKGVRLSHRNIVINGMQVGMDMRPRADDIYLHIAPMFHAADLFAMTYSLAGAAHAFLPAFSGQAVLEAFQRYRVTTTMMTPTMVIMALQAPDFAKYDLSSLRQLFYGSSPMAAEWIKKTLETFKGVEVIQGYGLTETSPILTILPMEEHVRALETGNLEALRGCGRPLPTVDMKIRDEEGNEVPPNTPGEITVAAPNVSKGYLNRPEETKAAFRDGWFYTGDLARMDEDGFVHLLDRKKDMVITGGENVYTSEVEAALYQHEGVHECAVVGVPDDKYGEALLAAIVPAPGASLDEKEMIAHCRALIGGFKIPRRYVFVDELPKSAMNKILKNELRATYGGDAAKKEPS